MVIDDWVQLILESLYDGVLIVDPFGVVEFVNNSYTRITGVKREEIVGRPLTSVRPGSQLHQVLETGRRMLGVHRKVDSVEYIVNMVPIIEDGQIAGAISLLNEVGDVVKLAETLEKTSNMLGDLETKVRTLRGARYTFDDIIHKDPGSSQNIQLASKIAGKDLNVLLIGESGTGKELYAQSIHNASSRRNKPFIPVNCATLDTGLLESELFGYKDGAFTGAKRGGKKGIFQEANEGTVFLDEVTEMDVRTQAKLLRTLQERTIRPVGGSSEQSINVRVIAATNREIEPLISQKVFREDLFYRLSAFSISLHPLRERRDDIPLLVSRFVDSLNQGEERHKNVMEDAMRVLCSYEWPGNVRELRNAVEYAYAMSDDDSIGKTHLPRNLQHIAVPADQTNIRTLQQCIEETEAAEIRKALEKYGNSLESKKQVAELLGISLASLYSKIKKMDKVGA